MSDNESTPTTPKETRVIPEQAPSKTGIPHPPEEAPASAPDVSDQPGPSTSHSNGNGMSRSHLAEDTPPPSPTSPPPQSAPQLRETLSATASVDGNETTYNRSSTSADEESSLLTTPTPRPSSASSGSPTRATALVHPLQTDIASRRPTPPPSFTVSVTPYINIEGRTGIIPSITVNEELESEESAIERNEEVIQLIPSYPVQNVSPTRVRFENSEIDAPLISPEATPQHQFVNLPSARVLRNLQRRVTLNNTHNQPNSTPQSNGLANSSWIWCMGCLRRFGKASRSDFDMENHFGTKYLRTVPGVLKFCIIIVGIITTAVSCNAIFNSTFGDNWTLSESNECIMHTKGCPLVVDSQIREHYFAAISITFVILSLVSMYFGFIIVSLSKPCKNLDAVHHFLGSFLLCISTTFLQSSLWDFDTFLKSSNITEPKTILQYKKTFKYDDKQAAVGMQFFNATLYFLAVIFILLEKRRPMALPQPQ